LVGGQKRVRGGGEGRKSRVVGKHTFKFHRGKLSKDKNKVEGTTKIKPNGKKGQKKPKGGRGGAADQGFKDERQRGAREIADGKRGPIGRARTMTNKKEKKEGAGTRGPQKRRKDDNLMEEEGN